MLKLLSYLSQLFFLFWILILPSHAQRVEITSDEMHAQNMKKEIHFLGNVTIKQSDNVIDANRVIVYFNENNETRKYEALEEVKFEIKDEKNHYKGSADRLIYLPKESKYTLSGQAIVNDIINKRYIHGDEILLDLLSGNAKVHGTKKKPVKVILNIEDK